MMRHHRTPELSRAGIASCSGMLLRAAEVFGVVLLLIIAIPQLLHAQGRSQSAERQKKSPASDASAAARAEASKEGNSRNLCVVLRPLGSEISDKAGKAAEIAILRMQSEIENARRALEAARPQMEMQFRFPDDSFRIMIGRLELSAKSLEPRIGRFFMADSVLILSDSLRSLSDVFRIRADSLRFMTDSIRIKGDSIRVLVRRLGDSIRVLQPRLSVALAPDAVRFGSDSAYGYIGISMSGAETRSVSSSGILTRHCEYPAVEAVDPGSPADRAGISAGDTVLAYNGKDLLADAINYPELLKAGSDLRIRLRHGGRTRDVQVKVASRRPARVMHVSGMPAASFFFASPSSAAQVVSFAGAQFTVMDEELATSVGLGSGALVLRVPPGTPAADAGLRGGEVVRQVNGKPASDALTLRRLLAESGSQVRLTVSSRGKSEHTVTIKLR